MTSSEPAYEGEIKDATGAVIFKFRVLDLPQDWLFQFGLQGENIGFLTVGVPKHHVTQLNFLGTLERALMRLDTDKKRHSECGLPMNQYRLRSIDGE